MNNEQWLIAGAIYTGLEYWLGKTTLVKSNSTLELVFNFIGTLLKGKSV